MRTEEEIILPEETTTNPPSTIAMIIVFVWALLGLLGFATSIACFAFDGTFMQNWVGFLTSIVLGPFYWIYFAYVDPSYCTSNKSSVAQKQVFNKKFTKGKRKAPKKI